MSITLWGRHGSINVQKVVWTLLELKLAFEHIPLGGKFGGLGEPSYLELNPNGRIPTLRDGDLVVWESNAVVRYLAATYGAGSLWPDDPKARARVDQWTDWAATTFQPAWLAAFEAVVRTPPAQQDQALIRKTQGTAERLYKMLDGYLASRSFLGGDRLSYADIVAGASLHRWMTMPIEHTPMANLEAWYRRLLQRPGFTIGVCISYAELVGVPTPA